MGYRRHGRRRGDRCPNARDVPDVAGGAIRSEGQPDDAGDARVRDVGEWAGPAAETRRRGRSTDGRLAPITAIPGDEGGAGVDESARAQCTSGDDASINRVSVSAAPHTGT